MSRSARRICMSEARVSDGVCSELGRVANLTHLRHAVVDGGHFRNEDDEEVDGRTFGGCLHDVDELHVVHLDRCPKNIRKFVRHTNGVFLLPAPKNSDPAGRARLLSTNAISSTIRGSRSLIRVPRSLVRVSRPLIRVPRSLVRVPRSLIRSTLRSRARLQSLPELVPQKQQLLEATPGDDVLPLNLQTLQYLVRERSRVLILRRSRIQSQKRLQSMFPYLVLPQLKLDRLPPKAQHYHHDLQRRPRKRFRCPVGGNVGGKGVRTDTSTHACEQKGHGVNKSVTQ